MKCPILCVKTRLSLPDETAGIPRLLVLLEVAPDRAFEIFCSDFISRSPSLLWLFLRCSLSSNLCWSFWVYLVRPPLEH